MDLNDLAPSSDTAVLTLRHPTDGSVLMNDDGTPMTITLMGSDSEPYQKSQRSATNRRLAQTGKRGGQSKLTAEELLADNIEALTAVTKSWNVTLDKAKPECEAPVVRQTYKKFIWLREQVDDFVGDRANFVKDSAAK